MKKLYVGNLSFSVTEENIRTEFAKLGIHTDSITVVRDRDTGQPRGLGFVEIGDDVAAEKAVANLNGKDLLGRALVVNEARPHYYDFTTDFMRLRRTTLNENEVQWQGSSRRVSL